MIFWDGFGGSGLVGIGEGKRMGLDEVIIYIL